MMEDGDGGGDAQTGPALRQPRLPIDDLRK